MLIFKVVMKQRIIFIIIGLVLGFAFGYYVKPSKSSEMEDAKRTLDNAREASVKLNIQFNHLYDQLGLIALENGNKYAIASFQTLQKLTPNIMQISKSLRMDCKQYDDNGKPIMVENDKTGQTTPIEALPEEIRIENAE